MPVQRTSRNTDRLNDLLERKPITRLFLLVPLTPSGIPRLQMMQISCTCEELGSPPTPPPPPSERNIRITQMMTIGGEKKMERKYIVSILPLLGIPGLSGLVLLLLAAQIVGGGISH